MEDLFVAASELASDIAGAPASVYVSDDGLYRETTVRGRHARVHVVAWDGRVTVYADAASCFNKLSQCPLAMAWTGSDREREALRDAVTQIAAVDEKMGTRAGELEWWPTAVTAADAERIAGRMRALLGRPRRDRARPRKTRR